MKTKTPKARVMYTIQKDLEYLSTLIVQPKRYGTALDVTLLVQPFRTRAQAEKAKRWANLGYWAKVDAIATPLAKLRAGKTWPLSAQDMAISILALQGVEP